MQRKSKLSFIRVVILLFGLSFTQNSLGMERVIKLDVGNIDDAALTAAIIDHVKNMYALGERCICVQELNGSNLSQQDFSRLQNLFKELCKKTLILDNQHLGPVRVFLLKNADEESADFNSLVSGESQINFQIKEYYSAEFRKNFYCICIGAGVGIFIIIVLSILSEYLGGNVYSHSDG